MLGRFTHMKNCKHQLIRNNLVFLHIPKTGGGTLYTILNKRYEKGKIFDIDSSNVYKSIEEFKNFSQKRRLEIKLLRGHMPFGLHEYLPNSSEYITLMRGPVDRIISYYYYLIRTPAHYLYDEVISQNMTLEKFVCSEITTEMDNHQVRLISGVGDHHINFGECSQQ